MKTGRSLLSLCLLLGFLSTYTKATAILAVRFPGGIFVFADSKPTYLRSGGKDTVCKIIPIKNAFMAVSGMVRDPYRDFDVEAISAAAFDSAGSFLSHVRHATKLVRERATTELKRLKVEDPSQYEFALSNHRNVLDVLFVAYEAKVPILAARQLRWNETKSALELIRTQDCPGSACPSGTLLSVIGEASEIQKFIDAHQKGGNVSEDILKDLMTRQIEATPKKVGFPIEILALQETGATWHANDLGCPLSVKDHR
jgi:hypothetical protein